jgi:hypothetical protein
VKFGSDILKAYFDEKFSKQFLSINKEEWMDIFRQFVKLNKIMHLLHAVRINFVHSIIPFSSIIKFHVTSNINIEKQFSFKMKSADIKNDA